MQQVSEVQEGILRALIVGPFEGMDTFTAPHNRLANDLRFRYQCCLEIGKPAPSISTLSRVFSLATAKKLAEEIFRDLFKTAQNIGVISGATRQ